MVMDLPTLTICFCTCRRPQYGSTTINAFKQWAGYEGRRKFHIADGGSPQEEIDTYLQILHGEEVTVEVTDNLADMVNSCARHGGDLWLVTLDDFCLRYPVNFTPDAKLLLTHADIGQVRFGRLNNWGSGSGDPETSGDMVTVPDSGLHWWKLDKDRTRDGYMCNIGTHMYHRRFWEAYGDIPSCVSNVPGQGELNGCARFNGKPGPTIAIPMRFGQDCDFHLQPIWHFGHYRTDAYAETAGTRL